MPKTYSKGAYKGPAVFHCEYRRAILFSFYLLKDLGHYQRMRTINLLNNLNAVCNWTGKMLPFMINQHSLARLLIFQNRVYMKSFETVRLVTVEVLQQHGIAEKNALSVSTKSQ